ncbi:hypothetical protein SAMN05444515_1266 [Ectothiorhodospira marina]|uniref:Uncharacterized protein n=1 Tax=Ectothiorhodospira marina TaxID=1396821 RepID=A0A1H7RR62_9GAMM|nr:hypothetical protein SAMN05444515_1266 [Ectothiorhodospira marina]
MPDMFAICFKGWSKPTLPDLLDDFCCLQLSQHRPFLRFYIPRKASAISDILRHLCFKLAITNENNHRMYLLLIQTQQGLNCFYMLIILMQWILELT